MAKTEVMLGRQIFQVLIDVSTVLLFKNCECCLPLDCSNVYFRLLFVFGEKFSSAFRLINWVAHRACRSELG